MNNKLERGSASILVDLTDNTIRVYHGTDNVLLHERTAYEGDWSKLFDTITNQ